MHGTTVPTLSFVAHQLLSRPSRINIVIFLSTFITCICKPVAAGEELQLAVQLVLFRQLGVALQLFTHFMWLSHHFGV